jgi:hypothetical protein
MATAAKAGHRAWPVPKSLILALSSGERRSAIFVEKTTEFVARLGYKVRGDGHNGISVLLPNG